MSDLPKAATPASPEPPDQNDLNRTARRKVGAKVLSGMGTAAVLWAGEATVGLLPLFTHLIISLNARQISKSATCDMQMASCHEIKGGLPLPEMQILAVIVCGLSILSLLSFGPARRKCEIKIFTYLVGLAALLLTIFASILYALTTEGTEVGNDSVTVWVLIFSLLSSFYLALEEAWLSALNGLES